LILHERDQRRHHDADAVAHERRDLVAERLAAARGHQHQRVAAVQRRRDDVPLLAAKRRIAEDLAQYLLRVLERISRQRRVGETLGLHCRHDAIGTEPTQPNNSP
jgi:hypothetical protein